MSAGFAIQLNNGSVHRFSEEWSEEKLSIIGERFGVTHIYNGVTPGPRPIGSSRLILYGVLARQDVSASSSSSATIHADGRVEIHKDKDSEKWLFIAESRQKLKKILQGQA